MKRCLILVFILSWGCQDDITVENLPGRITSIGPVEVFDADTAKIGVQFTVLDPEGDDVPIVFEICQGTEECGLAAIDTALSDPIARVPAIPKNTDVPHVVVWDANCGFFKQNDDTFSIEGAQNGVDYFVRLSVEGEDESRVDSPAFPLDVTLDENACTR